MSGDEEMAWRIATGMDSTDAMRLKSAIERALAAVRAEEREACAKLAENARVIHSGMLGSPHTSIHGAAISAAIRDAGRRAA